MEINNIGYIGNPIKYCNENKLFPNEYIDAFSEFVLNCSTPMTIALQGEWGIGKTSFYNLIKEKIGSQNIIENENNSHKAVFIEINTWLYSQFDLGNDLCITVLNAIVKKINSNEKIIIDCLKNIAISGLKKAFFMSLEGISNKIFCSKKAIEEIISTNLSEENIYKDIEKIRNEFKRIIEEKINKENQYHKKKIVDRVVIFIDDLDRVSPEKAVELLECFKNFLDVPNCVFIFAVDYDVVVKGACKKFGEEKGQAFFDKIVKLPFFLPVEHYNLREFLKYNMEKMFSEEYFRNEKTINLYVDIIEKSIGNNPRTIGRVLNSFYIMYNVDKYSFEYSSKNQRLKSTDSDNYEIKVVDLLFFFSCVRLKYRNVFNYLLNDLQKIADADKSSVNNYIGKFQREVDMHNAKIKDTDKRGLGDGDINNIKGLLNIYCNMLNELNNCDTLSPTTLYKIISRERATGGHINKL